ILQEYSGKWWRVFSGTYRRERRKVAALYHTTPPKDAAHQQAMVDAVIEAQHHEGVLRAHDDLGVQLSGAQWQGTASVWSTLCQVHQWVVEMYRDIDAGHLLPQVADVLAGQPDRDAV